MLGLGDNLTQSVASLRAYGLRSALTIVGLMMGVATIIAVISLIQGANHYVENKVANLGTNVFQISKSPIAAASFEQLVRSAKYRRFDSGDLAAVSAGCHDCAGVGGTMASQTGVRRANVELPDTPLFGHTASMAGIDSRVLAAGRYFTATEEERGARVCLLGDRVREELFGESDPLGGVVRLGAKECTVVGVFEKVGAVLGQDADAFVVVPLREFERLKGPRFSLTLNVKARSAELMESALDETRQVVRTRRQLPAGRPDDFFVGTKETYIALWRSLSGSFFVAFVAVSAITALVGGIVIMNVMLVSVTGRAKEIGLRRALGASQGDIHRQFLAESLLQCLAGGVVGVAAGFALAELVRLNTEFPVRIEPWMALLGVGFSSRLGLVFGIAPAVSAARLDPVEALRAE